MNNPLHSQDFIALEKKWCAQNYDPLPVVLTKGQGVWVWDVEGKKYLDMMSAYSVVNAGHSHPRLISALVEQATRLAVCSRAYYNDVLPLFLKKLCFMTRFERALPMNTGAEAVETAIKAMRRWGYQHRHIPENKAEIIVCDGNFHGRTVGIISFSSHPSYQKNFGPFLPGFKIVPFGDLKAFQEAITPYTCGVLLEPVQGEAGIVFPPEGWLKSIADLCKQENIMLVLDEIQSGLGRTGKILACEHDNVHPDGVLLGKALGGGLLPISAFVGSHDLLDVFDPGSHGSTFGGNPLSSFVGLRALEVLEEEDLCGQSEVLGQYFMSQLKKISSPAIRDLRGRGLWIGMDFDPHYVTGRHVCEQLLKEGILSKETHETVARFAPPLVITKEEIDWALQRIQKVIQDL